MSTTVAALAPVDLEEEDKLLSPSSTRGSFVSETEPSFNVENDEKEGEGDADIASDDTDEEHREIPSLSMY